MHFGMDLSCISTHNLAGRLSSDPFLNQTTNGDKLFSTFPVQKYIHKLKAKICCSTHPRRTFEQLCRC